MWSNSDTEQADPRRIEQRRPVEVFDGVLARDAGTLRFGSKGVYLGVAERG